MSENDVSTMMMGMAPATADAGEDDGVTVGVFGTVRAIENGEGFACAVTDGGVYQLEQGGIAGRLDPISEPIDVAVASNFAVRVSRIESSLP